MDDARKSSREDLQDKRLADPRMREAFFKKETERHRLLAEQNMELMAPSQRRLSVGFAPLAESEVFEMHAFFNCEFCDALLLKNPGLRQWGCSDCGLVLGADEADALLRAYSGALRTLTNTVHKQKEWRWPWQHWFRSKKADDS